MKRPSMFLLTSLMLVSSLGLLVPAAGGGKPESSSAGSADVIPVAKVYAYQNYNEAVKHANAKQWSTAALYFYHAVQSQLKNRKVEGDKDDAGTDYEKPIYPHLGAGHALLRYALQQPTPVKWPAGTTDQASCLQSAISELGRSLIEKPTATALLLLLEAYEASEDYDSWFSLVDPNRGQRSIQFPDQPWSIPTKSIPDSLSRGGKLAAPASGLDLTLDAPSGGRWRVRVGSPLAPNLGGPVLGGLSALGNGWDDRQFLQAWREAVGSTRFVSFDIQPASKSGVKIIKVNPPAGTQIASWTLRIQGALPDGQEVRATGTGSPITYTWDTLDPRNPLVDNQDCVIRLAYRKAGEAAEQEARPARRERIANDLSIKWEPVSSETEGNQQRLTVGVRCSLPLFNPVLRGKLNGRELPEPVRLAKVRETESAGRYLYAGTVDLSSTDRGQLEFLPEGGMLRSSPTKQVRLEPLFHTLRGEVQAWLFSRSTYGPGDHSVLIQSLSPIEASDVKVWVNRPGRLEDEALKLAAGAANSGTELAFALPVAAEDPPGPGKILYQIAGQPMQEQSVMFRTRSPRLQFFVQEPTAFVAGLPGRLHLHFSEPVDRLLQRPTCTITRGTDNLSAPVAVDPNSSTRLVIPFPTQEAGSYDVTIQGGLDANRIALDFGAGAGKPRSLKVVVAEAPEERRIELIPPSNPVPAGNAEIRVRLEGLPAGEKPKPEAIVVKAALPDGDKELPVREGSIEHEYIATFDALDGFFGKVVVSAAYKSYRGTLPLTVDGRRPTFPSVIVEREVTHPGEGEKIVSIDFTTDKPLRRSTPPVIRVNQGLGWVPQERPEPKGDGDLQWSGQLSLRADEGTAYVKIEVTDLAGNTGVYPLEIKVKIGKGDYVLEEPAEGERWTPGLRSIRIKGQGKRPQVAVRMPGQQRPDPAQVVSSAGTTHQFAYSVSNSSKDGRAAILFDGQVVRTVLIDAERPQLRLSVTPNPAEGGSTVSVTLTSTKRLRSPRILANDAVHPKALTQGGQEGAFEYRTEYTVPNSGLDSVNFGVQLMEEPDRLPEKMPETKLAVQARNWDLTLTRSGRPLPPESNAYLVGPGKIGVRVEGPRLTGLAVVRAEIRWAGQPNFEQLPQMSGPGEGPKSRYSGEFEVHPSVRNGTAELRVLVNDQLRGSASLRVDTIGPKLQLRADPVPDGQGPASIRLTIDNEEDLPQLPTGNVNFGMGPKPLAFKNLTPGEQVVSVSIPAGLEPNDYPIEVVAVDRAGNRTEARASITVGSRKLRLSWLEPGTNPVKLESIPTAFKVRLDGPNRDRVLVRLSVTRVGSGQLVADLAEVGNLSASRGVGTPGDMTPPNMPPSPPAPQDDSVRIVPSSRELREIQKGTYEITAQIVPRRSTDRLPELEAPKLTITYTPPEVEANRWAIVVGIGDYDSQRLKDLPAPRRDAERLAKSLVSECGYKPQHVTVLTDDAIDGSGLDPARLRTVKVNTHFMQEVRKTIEEARKANARSLLFFFAGHGIQDGQAVYLLTPNTDTSDPVAIAASSLPLNVILNYAADAEHEHANPIPDVLLMIDACRTGPDGKSALENPRPAKRTDNQRVAVYYACSSGQSSWEQDGIGFFTGSLVKLLKGGQRYSGRQFVDALNTAVKKTATEDGKEQWPEVYGIPNQQLTESILGSFFNRQSTETMTGWHPQPRSPLALVLGAGTGMTEAVFARIASAAGSSSASASRPAPLKPRRTPSRRRSADAGRPDLQQPRRFVTAGSRPAQYRASRAGSWGLRNVAGSLPSFPSHSRSCRSIPQLG